MRGARRLAATLFAAPPSMIGRRLLAGSFAAILIGAGAPALAAALEFTAADGRIGFAPSDIRGVHIRSGEKGTVGLTVCLDDAAAQEFAAFTERSVGQRIEMRIGGVVVSAAIVRAPIHGGCAFAGRLTAEEAATHRDILLGGASAPIPPAPAPAGKETDG